MWRVIEIYPLKYIVSIFEGTSLREVIFIEENMTESLQREINIDPLDSFLFLSFGLISSISLPPSTITLSIILFLHLFTRFILGIISIYINDKKREHFPGGFLNIHSHTNMQTFHWYHQQSQNLFFFYFYTIYSKFIFKKVKSFCSCM